MTWTHKPLEFAELAGATQLYLYVVGTFFAAIVLVFLLIQTVRHGFSFRPALPSVGRLTLFLIVALVVSSMAQLVWSTCVWGRLYHTPDYVFGYLPFVPITQEELDGEFAGQTGSLNGVTLLYLNLLWSGLTFVVWLLSYWLYRLLRPTGARRHGIPTTQLAS